MDAVGVALHWELTKLETHMCIMYTWWPVKRAIVLILLCRSLFIDHRHYLLINSVVKSDNIYYWLSNWIGNTQSIIKSIIWTSGHKVFAILGYSSTLAFTVQKPNGVPLNANVSLVIVTAHLVLTARQSIVRRKVQVSVIVTRIIELSPLVT